MATTRRSGSPLPPNWPSIRQAIRHRDNSQCQWRLDDGLPCLATPVEVDHRGDPDNHHPDNLWCLCKAHHNAKTAAESLAGRGHGPGRRHPGEPHPGIA